MNSHKTILLACMTTPLKIKVDLGRTGRFPEDMIWPMHPTYYIVKIRGSGEEMGL